MDAFPPTHFFQISTQFFSFILYFYQQYKKKNLKLNTACEAGPPSAHPACPLPHFPKHDDLRWIIQKQFDTLSTCSMRTYPCLKLLTQAYHYNHFTVISYRTSWLGFGRDHPPTFDPKLQSMRLGHKVVSCHRVSCYFCQTLCTFMPEPPYSSVSTGVKPSLICPTNRVPNKPTLNERSPFTSKWSI